VPRLIAAAATLCLLALVGLMPARAFVPDVSLLLTLRPGADPDAPLAVAQAAGARVVNRLSPLPIYSLLVPSGTDPEALLGALRESPGVRAAEIEGEQVIQVVPNDSLYRAFQWNLRRIGMEPAWDLRPSASDVVVAVLDTGADLAHPDLRPNLLVDLGYDFLNEAPSPQDDESHGTAVAGIIGAVGNNGEGVSGIAWHVKILPIKALNNQGRGPDSAMVKAILHAIDHGARIINISSTGARYSAALQTAVAYAQDRGALVVAAAGNTGDRDNAVNFPAAFEGVLAVAAIDEHDQLAPFSQRRSYVALAAPGVDVPSTSWSGAGRGPYATQSGTSIAAPHVTGTAALLWAMRPDLSASDIAATLRATADPVVGGPEGYGSGILNAGRAVAALRLGLPPREPDAMVSRVDRPSTGPIPTPGPLALEARRWYFAEGSTQPPFEVSFALQNPNPVPTIAHFLFLSPDGRQTPFDLRLEASSRTTLNANEVHPNAEFSTIVNTDIPVYVERSMYFGHDGHSAVGARQANREWFLAEGSTVPPFETWILLMNPNPAPTLARLQFMREDGTVVEHAEAVPGMGRTSVFVNALFTTAGFATRISSDQPLVVERAMYFDAGQGGHDTLATPTPGKTWYLAAGTSRAGFDTWLLVENPGGTPANVRVSFLTEMGTVVNQPLFVLPHARTSLFTDPLVPEAAFGIRVESDQDIVAERAVYFDGGKAGFGGTGVPAPATEWFLPEGSSMGSFVEQLAILNPQTVGANVQVDFRPQGSDRASIESRRFLVGPTSRVTLDINPEVPDANVALRIIADRPIVVERTSYFARPTGLGATSSSGVTR
jgi:subtilisin family serine protease